jgi:Domain of unknown function (DUF4259)
VGSWGTGPFHNDAAMDLLEQLADYPAAQRTAVLRQLFAAVLRDPDADSFEIAFPEGYTDRLSATEVVAGAALLALALPGGERIHDVPVSQSFPGGGIPDLVTGAAVPAPTPDVAAMAAEALRAVTDPTRLWSQTWVAADDRAMAQQGVVATLAVLDAFARTH